MKSDHILLFTPTNEYIEFPFAIRKGICENCGKSKAKGEISVTQLHHKNNKKEIIITNTNSIIHNFHKKF